MEYANIFYIPLIKKVSGITTWMLEIAKKYNKIDITVVYSDTKSSIERINQLRQYVRVLKINPDTQPTKIKCKKLFITAKVKDTRCFEADEIIGTVQTYFPLAHLNPYKNVDKVIAVSEHAAKGYEEISGIKPFVCYNPLTLDKDNKVLRLIYVGRINDKKGSERTKILLKAFDNYGGKYQLMVIGDNDMNITNENIIYIPPKLDVRPYIKNSDYLVQLGDDDEGYSYTINEALDMGVPIIATNMSVLKELGIKDKEHGYLIDFDMSNIPVEDIFNNIPKPKYTPPEDNWLDYLDKTSAEYVKEHLVKLRALRQYKDVEFDRTIKKGELFETYESRAKHLVEELQYAEYEDIEPNPNCPYTISVIIPVWNQETLITRTLDSIPTRKNVEIIVIDDKSTDNTYKVLLDYKKDHKEKNIRLLHNMDNKGVGYTFNRGLSEATGDYIVRIDSDDYFYTGQFNHMVDEELDSTDMIYYNLEDNNNRILEVNRGNRASRCGAVKFIRREFIGDTRCPEIRTAEDKAFNDELLMKYPSEKFTNRIVYHYNYPRENSLTDLTKRGLL